MQMQTITAVNGQPLKLTWEKVLEQFDNLIKFAARKEVENSYRVDNMISAEDLYQDGLIKLYDCWEKWCVGQNKDMDEFAPIFKTSLFRCVQQRTGKQPTFIDIEDTVNTLRDESSEDVIERMSVDAGLETLKTALSPIAQSLLEELMEPSERTIFEVWADIERKKMLKSQGKRVNIPKDTTIRMKHIVRSLGITGKQYDVAMLEIREKANELIEL